jgi:hypothetical protein
MPSAVAQVSGPGLYCQEVDAGGCCLRSCWQLCKLTLALAAAASAAAGGSMAQGSSNALTSASAGTAMIDISSSKVAASSSTFSSLHNARRASAGCATLQPLFQHHQPMQVQGTQQQGTSTAGVSMLRAAVKAVMHFSVLPCSDSSYTCTCSSSRS